MYKSPIELLFHGIEAQLEKGIVQAVAKHDIIVDREELIRALEYDRGQYEKGYQDAIDTIVKCKNCEYEKKCLMCIELIGDTPITTSSRHIDFCSYGERKDND